MSFGRPSGWYFEIKQLPDDGASWTTFSRTSYDASLGWAQFQPYRAQQNAAAWRIRRMATLVCHDCRLSAAAVDICELSSCMTHLPKYVQPDESLASSEQYTGKVCFSFDDVWRCNSASSHPGCGQILWSDAPCSTSTKPRVANTARP